MIAGDFCLDRYLEIDSAKTETSLETGLPVYNVVRVRSQPGGAGTVLNNLAALGIGTILPVGFCGDDGEGFELRRALAAQPGVRMTGFIQTAHRRTFTYCKPLILESDQLPRELNRLDLKNWSPTPPALQNLLVDQVRQLTRSAHALILLDQVTVPETGVVTRKLLAEIRRLTQRRPDLIIVADSRRTLRDFPPVIFKMNVRELSALTGTMPKPSLDRIKSLASQLARKNQRAVIVTAAEQGIVGASPQGDVIHVPALPVRGPIDVVGAGDAVTANLTAALAAGATLLQALELANAAASIVIHQLATTGTATVNQILQTLKNSRPPAVVEEPRD